MNILNKGKHLFVIFISITLVISCHSPLDEKFNFEDLAKEEVFNNEQIKDIENYFKIDPYYPQFKSLIGKHYYSMINSKADRIDYIDTVAYNEFTRRQLLDSVNVFNKRIYKFENWLERNAKNIDSTLSVHIPSFYISSEGKYDLCLNVNNRSNKFIKRFKGDILIYDDYLDVTHRFVFESEKMSNYMVNIRNAPPFNYVAYNESGNCIRRIFEGKPKAPREWINESGGKNISGYREKVEFIVTAIIFNDGNLLKRESK